MCRIAHRINVLLFLIIPAFAWVQTEEDKKEEAAKLFEKEQYVDATPLYLHLISLNPKDADYNFRYGTCLLFNSYQKQEAIRYLNYAVNEPEIDPRVLYFHGRALHLNYEFDKAIKSYRSYVSKRGKRDNRYDVERQIEMCENGKKLLTTFTDIVVSQKKEIDKAKFFRLYNDAQTIGGTILVSEEFQSKLDKKHGHIPIVHYPPNPQAIYYSSYGEDESTGLDIYIRRKLPDGTWGESQLLPGDVNTNQNEDFPYMHPSGEYLYFSSKGHNSMGGYDVFYSLYNPNTNSFGKPVNVDFAISSPDDDLFYVVDEAHKNAYFASARQSQNGKLHVYKVRVARVPIQEVIIMGDYISEINPDNKEMFITVYNHANGEEVGKIRSNDKGKFSFVFPRGGKYDYEVTVGESEDVYKFLIEVPFLDEFRPLKQKALHKTQDGGEIVQIVNLFDEKVEGAEALIAEVIRKRSELEVNVDNFDLEALDAQEERDLVLAEMGFQGMSMNEVSDQLEDLAITEKLNLEKVGNIEANINNEIVIKSRELKSIDEEIDALNKELSAADSERSKYDVLMKINSLERAKLLLATEIENLGELRNKIVEVVGSPSESGIRKMEMLENQFNALMSENKEKEALDLLAKNKDEVNNARSASPNGIVDEMVKESVALSNEIDGLVAQQREMEQEQRRLKEEIKVLENRLPDAKKKDAAQIKEDIDSKEAELKLTEDFIAKTNKKIDEKEGQLSVLDNNIASLQTAMLTEPGVLAEVSEVENSVKAAQEAKSEVESSSVEDQIAMLEQNSPELNPDNETNVAVQDYTDQYNIIEANNSEKTQEISTNPSLSQEERINSLVENNQESIKQIDNRIAEIKEILEESDNEQLRTEQEKLEEYKTQLSEVNEGYQQELAALNETDVIPENYENQYNIIEANNSEKSQEISTNPSLSQQERINSLVTNNEETIEQIDNRIEELELMLKESDNEQLRTEQEKLEEYKTQLSEVNGGYEQELATLNEADVAVSKEDIVAEVVPDYEERVEEIQRGDLSEKEKLEEIQKVDQRLVESISSELENINDALKDDPENGELVARKEILEEVQQETAAVIEERSNAIENLESDVVADVNKDEIRSDLENELLSSYIEDMEEIQSSNDPEFEKNAAVIALEVEYLTDLNKRKEEVEKQLERTPDDVNIQGTMDVIETMIQEQEEKIEQHKASVIAGITEQQIQKAVQKADRNYSVEIGELYQSNSPTQNDDIANREDVLQDALTRKIQELKKDQERKYSVTAELEMAVLMKAKEESEARGEAARSGAPMVDATQPTEQKETYIASVRSEALLDESALETTFSSKEELLAQDELLAEYEEQLDKKIKEARDEIKDDPDNQILSEQVDWLTEEKERVIEKRRSISISLGELETEIIESDVVNTTEAKNEVEKLQNKKEELQAELEDENVSKSREKEIKKEIKELDEELTSKEIEVYTADIKEQEKENSNLKNSIETLKTETPDNGTADQVLAINEQEQKVINEIKEEAENAGSEEERSYLLREAAERQEKMNTMMASTAEDMERSKIESNENVDLLSKEELEKQQRRFSVQIGELTTEIMHADAEIGNAKKKEVPALETKRAGLVEQRKLLEIKLREVEDRLLEKSTTANVIAPSVMEEEITFNEERKVAGSEEYESYYNLASEALEQEKQIANLDSEIKEEQRKVNDELAKLSEERDNSIIELGVDRIKELQSEKDRLSVELVQMKYQADQALPTDENQAIQMQNLVLRGIKPFKATVVAAAILNMPTTGFAIDENAESVYSDANPIPVGVENPSGLVYRVQIGAFARPIPQDLFHEFNPVSGEKIGGTNITRYMAGFFSSDEASIDAREKIRALGYNDAFVVAYCDGERIPLWDARRKEASGACVPKGTDELMVEVAAKTAESLGLPTTNEVQEVPEHSYNEAPGAADADPIEIKQGLFFTVQIGVFNRPVGPEYTYGMEELMTIRLPNGQIRYASGIFDSVDEALPRRNKALSQGVKGAFVTAYYKGERIPLWQAKQLLEKNGRSILQSEIEKAEQEIVEVEPEVIEDTVPVNNVVRTDTVSAVNVTSYYEEDIAEQRIQIITKEQYSEFPRDVLNRYNAEGNFYFDAKDSHVKSVIYKSLDDLPRLWNFRENIDTVYLSMDESAFDTLRVLEIALNDSLPMRGDFADWLMRFNYRKEFYRLETGRVVRIFGVEPEKVEEVQGVVRQMGMEAILKEETEYELEISERE